MVMARKKKKKDIIDHLLDNINFKGLTQAGQRILQLNILLRSKRRSKKQYGPEKGRLLTTGIQQIYNPDNFAGTECTCLRSV